MFDVSDDGVGIGTTNGKRLRVIGDTEFTGNVRVGVITGHTHGDGNNLTNLNASATGWEQVASGLGTGIYNSAQTNVESAPQYQGSTYLGGPGFVQLHSLLRVILYSMGIAASDLTVGVITANNFRLNNSSTGHINAGIVTTGDLIVGTSGTIITTSSGQIGFGTVAPRSPVDVESRLRLKSYHEAVDSVSSASNNVNIDLSRQTYLTTTENVSRLR